MKKLIYGILTITLFTISTVTSYHNTSLKKSYSEAISFQTRAEAKPDPNLNCNTLSTGICTYTTCCTSEANSCNTTYINKWACTVK